MKKILGIIGTCVLINFGSNASTHTAKMYRTFSTFPQADILKRAICAADLEVLAELLPDAIPTGLHAQYVYLGLAPSDEVTELLIAAYFDSWYQRIQESPAYSLNALVHGCDTLTRDYEDAIDTRFKALLIKIQIVFLGCTEILECPELAQQVLSLPYTLHEGSLPFWDGNSEEEDSSDAVKAELVHYERPHYIKLPLPLQMRLE